MGGEATPKAREGAVGGQEVSSESGLSHGRRLSFSHDHGLQHAITETFFERFARAYASSKPLMFFQIFLALASVVVYVVETYDKGFEETNQAHHFEWVSGTAFAVDYVVSIYVAADRVRYACSLPAIADLLSTIPIVTLFLGSKAKQFNALKFFRLFKCTRVFRLHRLLSLGTSDIVRRKAISLALTVVCVVFFCAAVVHFLVTVGQPRGEFSDASGDEIQFDDAFYFIIVTFSTVGFGDIGPLSTTTRMVMVVFISASFILLPFQASQLATALSTQSEFAGRFSKGRTSGSSHVVVVGTRLMTKQIVGLLSELYHFDRKVDSLRLRTLVLAPHEPDDDMKAVLQSYAYQNVVKYFVGSSLLERDLQRVAVSDADAVILLTNSNESDHDVAMQVAVIHGCAPHVPIVARVESPGAQVFLRSYQQFSRLRCDLVTFSTASMQTALLAHSLVCPGFLAIASMLLHSVTAPHANPNSSDWRESYYLGWANQLYSVQVGDRFAGLSFWSMALVTYRGYHVTVLGVQTSKGFLVNPRYYRLEASDSVFVIARSKVVAEAIVRDERAHEAAATLGTSRAELFDESGSQASGDWDSALANPPNSERARGGSAKAGGGAGGGGTGSEVNGVGSKPESVGSAHEDADIAEAAFQASQVEELNRLLGIARERLGRVDVAGLVEQAKKQSVSPLERSRVGSPLPPSRLPAPAAGVPATLGGPGAQLAECVEAVRDCAIALSRARGGKRRLDRSLPTSGHILLCVLARKAEWLALLLSQLLLLCDREVVVLCDDEDTVSELRARLSAKSLGRVFLVIGSPESAADRRRCNCERAFSTAVLSTPTLGAQGAGADARVVSLTIELMSNDPGWHTHNCVAELNDLVNVRFLEIGLQDAHGHGGFASSAFAFGQVLASNTLNTLPVLFYLTPLVARFLGHLLNVDHERRQGCALAVKAVPPEFANALYVDLVDHFLSSHGWVAVGVLRAAGVGGSLRPFVLTNPPTTTLLGANDKVFVVLPQPPFATPA